MGRLLGYFARGLVLLAPLVVTVWFCWLVFTRVDGWLGLPIPGAGFAATMRRPSRRRLGVRGKTVAMAMVAQACAGTGWYQGSSGRPP